MPLSSRAASGESTRVTPWHRHVSKSADYNGLGLVPVSAKMVGRGNTEGGSRLDACFSGENTKEGSHKSEDELSPRLLSRRRRIRRVGGFLAERKVPGRGMKRR